jgi:hypothetical protein
MLQYRSMSQELSPALEPPAYRVTLFFGPEPVGQRLDEVACVFNVKKRSWKAGIQVSVEVRTDQLTSLREAIRLNDRLAQAFSTLDPRERPEYGARATDLFAQAVSWCKLDLGLQAGLTQENQRLLADQWGPELEQAISARTEYVLTYILTELDLTPHEPSPSM